MPPMMPFMSPSFLTNMVMTLLGMMPSMIGDDGRHGGHNDVRRRQDHVHRAPRIAGLSLEVFCASLRSVLLPSIAAIEAGVIS
jgi:hypothetical protein